LTNKLNLYYPIIADMPLKDIFENLSELCEWENTLLTKRDDQEKDNFTKQERAEQLRQAIYKLKFNWENNPEIDL